MSDDGVVDPAGSVSFDRAADFYDRTRVLPPALASAQTDLLAESLAGMDRPCLEIGVGTGRIALPLAERQVRVVGVDLSVPMLDRLRAKDEAGRVLAVVGDATSLPFGTGSFGGAIACHVLHLVADWVAAVEELRRVVVPGGVLLATRGAARDGLLAEVTARIRAASGAPVRQRSSLDRLDELDSHLAAVGARVDHLPALERPVPASVDGGGARSVGVYLDDLAAGIYSWTWDLPPDRLAEAIQQTREWLAAEHGDPARLVLPAPPIRWHRYVLP